MRLDPENAALHNSIGELLLHELADPVEAVRAHREAVRIEPNNRDYQADLFQAVAESSFVYRLFSIPSRTFTWLGFSRARPHPAALADSLSLDWVQSRSVLLRVALAGRPDLLAWRQGV